MTMGQYLGESLKLAPSVAGQARPSSCAHRKNIGSRVPCNVARGKWGWRHFLEDEWYSNSNIARTNHAEDVAA